MFYVDNNSGVATMPALSPAQSNTTTWFTEGDSVKGISWIGQDWLNIIQAELLNILAEAGIQPDKSVLNQLTLAIKAIIAANAFSRKNNLKEIADAGADAQRLARSYLGLGALATKDSLGPVDVNALSKDQNGADIPDKGAFIDNIGLQETVQRADNAVQKTGDSLSGGLTFENDSILAWIRNTDWAKIGFKNNSDDDTDSYMWFHTGDNGNEYFKWRSTSGSTIKDLMNLKWDALYVLVNAVISGSLSVGTTKKFTWSSSNSSTKNAGFNLWGNSSRPVVAELGDDSGWHFYSQRNTDDSITFAVNGQISPGNWSNFDARYAKSSAIVSGVRLGSIASYTPGNETTWTKNLGSGNVLTGIIVQDTGKNSADNIGGIYYRPVQYCINGSWVAASSI
ncbi:TPA: phage tail protein [Escherichia coli]|nr:phage tail protein [Escherichia coli]